MLKPLRLRTMRLSIVMLLVAGLSEGQAKDEGNEIHMYDLTHEDLADTKVEDNNSGLTKSATTVNQSCEPPIYSVLMELGALRERLSATVRALEETNKKLEASEKNLFALNKTVTELSKVDQGQSKVAFSVAQPLDGTIGPVNVLHPLVYKHVLSNVGGHYNQHTGQYSLYRNAMSSLVTVISQRLCFICVC
ncbi:complement C1q 2 [Solea senegalensis]|uniref:Complement C1q 2 n=1 Tax=Solea senegalensis TaxID=28829 RepID=A0AAV6QUF3_SOLSE|nr:complement C1q 2 [Solea senegalensis]